MKEEKNRDVLEPKVSASAVDKKEVVSCLGDLLGTRYEELSDFVDDKEELLFLVNDGDRPTPTSFFLEIISDYLKEEGIDLFSKEVDVVVATGSHSEPSERELKNILGKYYDSLKDELVIHRAKENNHIEVGKTERGTPIEVDEAILGYDGVLNINSVEPHYFAGYTGGRKSLVPGVSSWRTIEENHRLALDKRSKSLSLRNNPVHLDILDASKQVLDYLDTEFCSINAVCGSEKIYSVCCGDFFASFDALTDDAEEIFCREINQLYDLVVARVGDPLNKSLYQSLKGFENGKLALKKDGVLILVSRCSEGIGPKEFYKAISEGDKPKEIINDIESNYSLGEHKSSNLLKFLENHNLFVVSELSDREVRNCFCKPFDELNKAIEAAKKEIDKEDISILDIKEAGNVVPKLIKN